jgi:hypothetical protein
MIALGGLLPKPPVKKKAESCGKKPTSLPEESKAILRDTTDVICATRMGEVVVIPPKGGASPQL